MYLDCGMKITLVALAILPAAVLAQETHLDVMVPERIDTDLSGLVKSVDTKVSINVSGKFERERSEYDRIGNLLSETEWDLEGECISTLTNYYDENGNFERQLYADYEDGCTNDWEVILNPDTHQIAMKEVKSGGAAVYTYSPAGYLVSYRYADRDKKLKEAFVTKRDEQNRPKEYTRMDDRKKPLYTYWFKWKDDGTIDRERQRYRQGKGERLHVYDYLKADDHDNWIQRLMVRYDIDSEKKKIYERLAVRTIEYFEPEPTATEWTDTVATNAVEELSTNALDSVTTNNDVAEASESNEAPGKTNIGKQGVSTAATGRSQEELKAEFDYTFDDLSDKLVSISCKSESGRSYGSGFVAKMNGRTYLFTNQHIILGAEKITFTTVSGEKLHPKKIELSTTRDIARLLISDETGGLGITDDMPMGSSVGVFGKNETDGVSTGFYGTVTGVGGEIVEISAEFVTENSGSPVLNINQEVLGIASYVRESNTHAMKEGTKFEDRTRRFCYRLIGNQWKSVNWKVYNGKNGTFYRQQKMFTAGIIELLENWGDTPKDKVSITENPEQKLVSWVDSHNEMIVRYGRNSKKKRFADEYSESLHELSEACRSRAILIRTFSDQQRRELTEYLRDEFDMQATTLDNIANLLVHISKRVQDYR